MQVLWKLNKAFVKDIIDDLPEPKPAYNTVSTIVRILEKKGFIDHESFGKSHRYFPAIEKEEYTRDFMKSFVRDYFNNSFQKMVSFFAKEEDIDIKDLEKLLESIEKDKNKK